MRERCMSHMPAGRVALSWEEYVYESAESRNNSSLANRRVVYQDWSRDTSPSRVHLVTHTPHCGLSRCWHSLCGRRMRKSR
jgi:hypothetical protein